MTTPHRFFWPFIFLFIFLKKLHRDAELLLLHLAGDLAIILGFGANLPHFEVLFPAFSVLSAEKGGPRMPGEGKALASFTQRAVAGEFISPGTPFRPLA